MFYTILNQALSFIICYHLLYIMFYPIYIPTDFKKNCPQPQDVVTSVNGKKVATDQALDDEDFLYGIWWDGFWMKNDSSPVHI